MTNISMWRVGADIPPNTRIFLLRRFPPAFDTVLCLALTFAYGVPDSFSFPDTPLDAVLYGYHRGDAAECLLARVNGEVFRPDGERFFIALSTAPGVKPVRAGEIDSYRIVYFDDPIGLPITFQRFPLWQHQTDNRASYGAAGGLMRQKCSL